MVGSGFMNKKEALRIIEKKELELKNLPGHFKKDKKIVLEAVKQYGNALEYADKSLKKDKKIVLEAAKSMKRWRKIKSPMQKRNEGIFF